MDWEQRVIIPTAGTPAACRTQQASLVTTSDPKAGGEGGLREDVGCAAAKDGEQRESQRGQGCQPPSCHSSTGVVTSTIHADLATPTSRAASTSKLYREERFVGRRRIEPGLGATSG